MKAASWWQRTRDATSWRQAKYARLCTYTGGILGLITVILAMLNTISAQQAIAMSLPAAVAIIGGLMGVLIPDPWTAWRRVFRQGCQSCIQCKLASLNSDLTESAIRAWCDAPHGIEVTMAQVLRE